MLIACRMSSTTVLISDDSQPDPEGNIPRLYRWRFNLSTGTVREEMLDDVLQNFPVSTKIYWGDKPDMATVTKWRIVPYLYLKVSLSTILTVEILKPTNSDRDAMVVKLCLHHVLVQLLRMMAGL